MKGDSFIKEIHQKGHSSEILRVAKHKRREAKFGIKSIEKEAFPKSKVDSWNDFIFGGNVAKNLMVLSSEGLFKFELRSNQWDLVTCYEDKSFEEKCFDVDGYVNGCVFQDSFLVISSKNSLSPHVSLLKINDNYVGKSPPIIDKGIKKCLQGSTLFIKQNKSCHQIFCQTPIPTILCYCTATSLDDDKVFVIGGHPHAKDMKGFIGLFNSRKNDFNWKEISLKGQRSRVCPIMFKMGKTVFIAGGESYPPPTDPMTMTRCTKLSTCFTFNYGEKAWRKSDYILPYPLSHASVSVSPDETFAVVTGGLKGDTDYRFKSEKIGKPSNEIILFTKERGFILYDDKKLLDTCYSHTSILLTCSNS